MEAPATNTSTAHSFTRLPAELQDKIWLAALPDEVSPALYFYKPSGWYKRSKTQSGVVVYSHNGRLDPAQLDIPLFFVNHAARKIAIAWMRKHRIKLRAHYEQSQPPVHVIPFDPLRSTLYISSDQWMEFHRGRRLRSQSGILIHPDEIRRIAVPEALFQHRNLRPQSNTVAYLHKLTLINYWLPKLRELLIVFETPSYLERPITYYLTGQPRWELEVIKGVSFDWDSPGRRFQADIEGKLDRRLHKKMKTLNTITKLLTEVLERDRINLVVRPAFAMKK